MQLVSRWSGVRHGRQVAGGVRAGLLPVRRGDQAEQVQEEPEDRPALQQVRGRQRLAPVARQEEDIQPQQMILTCLLFVYKILLLCIVFAIEVLINGVMWPRCLFYSNSFMKLCFKLFCCRSFWLF